MMNVVLAGTYPEGTFEKFCAALPKEQYNLRAITSKEEYDAMDDAEIIILRIFKAPREVIERNKNLKMILRWGAGFDSVDIKAAGEHGVVVTNAPGANAGAVSELTVMLMLAVGRKLLCHIDSLRKGVWSKTTFMNQSFCLNQKLVGLIGGGNIGRQVAAKVQAFGAKVQYFDTFRLSPEREKALNMEYVPLQKLIETSDIISLHVPLLDSTRHMIGAKEIASMKNGAILINAARGGLVDDNAMLEAVKSGKLAGAGIDCTEREPLSADDALLANSNIIITPHIGGGTADLGNFMIPMLVEDIKTFASGKLPLHTVNKEYLKK